MQIQDGPLAGIQAKQTLSGDYKVDDDEPTKQKVRHVGQWHFSTHPGERTGTPLLKPCLEGRTCRCMHLGWAWKPSFIIDTRKVKGQKSLRLCVMMGAFVPKGSSGGANNSISIIVIYYCYCWYHMRERNGIIPLLKPPAQAGIHLPPSVKLATNNPVALYLGFGKIDSYSYSYSTTFPKFVYPSGVILMVSRLPIHTEPRPLFGPVWTLMLPRHPGCNEPAPCMELQPERLSASAVLLARTMEEGTSWLRIDQLASHSSRVTHNMQQTVTTIILMVMFWWWWHWHFYLTRAQVLRGWSGSSHSHHHCDIIISMIGISVVVLLAWRVGACHQYVQLRRWCISWYPYTALVMTWSSSMWLLFVCPLL